MKTFLHVGYPRTGTTWLQTKVYPNHPGIEFLHLYDWPLLIGVSQTKPKKTRVVCCEHFTDWRGGWGRIQREAALLNKLFPNAEIVLTAREPSDLLDSVYRYHVEHGGAISRKAFDEKFRREHPGWEDPENMIDVWKGLWGDIHVLRYEDLRADPRYFLWNLAKALDIEPFNGVSLKPENKGPRGIWGLAFKSVNCFSGLHDPARGSKEPGKVRKALAALNACLAVLLFIFPVYAHDIARPEYDEWYGSLKVPGTNTSCCDKTDCSPRVQCETDGRHGIEGDSGICYPIPEGAILDIDNPYIFKPVGCIRGGKVRCFIPAEVGG